MVQYEKYKEKDLGGEAGRKKKKKRKKERKKANKHRGMGETKEFSRAIGLLGENSTAVTAYHLPCGSYSRRRWLY